MMGYLKPCGRSGCTLWHVDGIHEDVTLTPGMQTPTVASEIESLKRRVEVLEREAKQRRPYRLGEHK